ncbi:anti-sigma factor [Microbacterium sp. NPDC057407]|uniref:anti-sigma factor n=1 Tax=Microbacterium sp. NPDC057407 TaxID=3346120 RepID=UPI003670CE8E
MLHLDPERLALLALGDDLTDAERDHLAACDECSIELAELEHTVAVGRSTVSLGTLESPPERVWNRILDEVHAKAATADAEPEAAEPEPVAAEAAPAQPEAAAEPARAQPEAPADAPAPRRRGFSRLTRTLFTLAASLVAVLAVVGVWNLVRPPESIEIASATLAAFPDHPGAIGEAQVTELPDGERTVTVRLDADASGDGFREVWLIKADASALVSLGELEGSEGTFVVPADVDLNDYVLVDVSQEPLDGDPTHSGDSIVRGELDFS